MLLCFAAWAGPTYNTDELTLEFNNPQHHQVLRVVKRDLERMHVRTERPLSTLQTSELLGLLVATQTQQRGSFSTRSPTPSPMPLSVPSPWNTPNSDGSTTKRAPNTPRISRL